MRYRLRFHLQEVDLPRDEVVIGRGSMCHITIDDPMLSRRHVRLDLRGPEPTLEDLKSRNGTQLNGHALEGIATLGDGDRIRLGTQELVFLKLRSAKTDFRTTSGLIFCVGCAVPYPSASPQCPHCGAVRTEHGESSAPREAAATGWTFHLLSQVVERAIDQGRLADAERMLSRGISELEEQLDAGLEVEPPRVLAIAESAAKLGCALRTARWLGVGAGLYRRAGESPSQEVLALLDELPNDSRISEAVDAVRHAGDEARQAS